MEAAVRTPPSCEKDSFAFWFGNEDREHLRVIFEHYARWLGVGAHRPAGSRAPPLFIGYLRRQPVLLRGAPHFRLSTRDVIRVYQRDAAPLGTPMKCVRCYRAYTDWDAIDGMPLTHRVDESATDSATDSLPLATADVFCLPVGGACSDQFEFVSGGSSDAGSSSNSSSLQRVLGHCSLESALVVDSMKTLLARLQQPPLQTLPDDVEVDEAQYCEDEDEWYELRSDDSSDEERDDAVEQAVQQLQSSLNTSALLPNFGLGFMDFDVDDDSDSLSFSP